MWILHMEEVVVQTTKLFQEIDIVKMSGYINSALVLNTSIPVSGRSLTITLQLSYNNKYTIISAIEIFEIVRDEAKTLLMKDSYEVQILSVCCSKNFAEIEPFVSVGMVIYVFRNSIHGVELGDE
uniref:Uncharacterized protein n=1 Tax=Lactuca sativa TaxID=4236 RepID=A0A9R1XBA2_LACSA|nr:hypothetical protein LSAT_V11C500235210 [Lactuca sativa]